MAASFPLSVLLCLTRFSLLPKRLFLTQRENPPLVYNIFCICHSAYHICRVMWSDDAIAMTTPAIVDDVDSPPVVAAATRRYAFRHHPVAVPATSSRKRKWRPCQQRFADVSSTTNATPTASDKYNSINNAAVFLPAEWLVEMLAFADRATLNHLYALNARLNAICVRYFPAMAPPHMTLHEMRLWTPHREQCYFRGVDAADDAHQLLERCCLLQQSPPASSSPPPAPRKRVRMRPTLARLMPYLRAAQWLRCRYTRVNLYESVSAGERL